MTRCSSAGPEAASHDEATLRITCSIQNEEVRMEQWSCLNCFHDTIDALRELGATSIIVGDTNSEARILSALIAVIPGRSLPR